MKKHKFSRYLFADTVSWILLAVTILLLVNHFVIGWDVSAFLAIVIFNMLYNIINKAKLLKMLDENLGARHSWLRDQLGINLKD